MLGARPLRGPGYRQFPQPGQSANAHPARLALRVGALFVKGEASNHFCTASVVDSPGGDLLITAAHCIDSGKGGGYRDGIVFVPGYQDGRAPFGIWAVARLIVSPQWASDSDPSLDVGFVVLKPHDGENIENILGANHDVWSVNVEEDYHETMASANPRAGTGRDAPILPKRVSI